MAMDISTVTCPKTPTLRGRKHLKEGKAEGGPGGGDEGGGGSGYGSTPVLSGSGWGEEDANITLKLWDFGGTEDFHAVHGLFFSMRALYTVVFDLRHVEKEDIDKRVQFWVDCVQTRLPGAYIQLVGTYVTGMEPAEAKARCDTVLKQV
ncbi:unnamed protein product, partial [Laminaria digitata]